MSDKDPVVKGIEKILKLLPEDLNSNEKEKVEEIQKILENLESGSKK